VADEGGLQIIDVGNPASPQWVGSYATSGYSEDVAVLGNYAYMVDGNGGLDVIDVSNPADPRHVGGYVTKVGTMTLRVGRGCARSEWRGESVTRSDRRRRELGFDSPVAAARLAIPNGAVKRAVFF
jgi:hypothetical protein